MKKGSVQKKTRKVHTQVQFRLPKTLALPRDPKYKRTSVAKRNKMDKYRIVKHPLTTESSIKKIEENNTLTFIVDILANKRQIRQAVKELYEVGVQKVNTLVRYLFLRFRSRFFVA